MLSKKEIFFVSDNMSTINNYRKDLFDFLKHKKINCKKIPIRKYILSLKFLHNQHLPIVSNIGSTLTMLIFFPITKKIIILNGLGMLKNHKLSRYLFLILCKLNKNTNFVCQNFTDYRWMRSKIKNVDHIVCSGGKKFNIYQGNSNHAVLITRKKKFIRTLKSIKSFLENTEYDLIVYGISDDFNLLPKKLKQRIKFMGWQKREDFFLKSNIFFQPYGQNEGFPHTLADAICSGSEIIIDRKLLIQLGLLSFTKQDLSGFGIIKSIECKTLQNQLNYRNINNQYFELINKLFI